MADTENILKINRDRENVLTFQVNIEGIDVNDISIRFCIDADNMTVCFPCEIMADNDYKVTIPPLGDIVGYGNYSCKIEVIANEYFFIAMSGTLKIVGTPNVKASLKREEENDEETMEQAGPVISASGIRVSTSEGNDGEGEGSADGTTNGRETDKEDTKEGEQKNNTSQINENSTIKDQQVRQILNELGLKRETKTHQFKSLKSFITR